MKYRILAGAELVRSTKKEDSLSLLHEGDNLRIEVGGESLVQRTPRGNTIVRLGHIMGRRNAAGILAPLESEAGFLAAAADHMPLADLADSLEGRFLLIRIHADDVCEVRADRFGKIEVFIQQAKAGVALASDLSLLPEDPARDGYDQAALAHTLSYYGYCPPKRHTIYKAVRRLGVGETARLNDGRLCVDQTNFQPVATAEYGEREQHEYCDIFLDHLRAAGSSEGNVVYLSSGWDSTSILAGLVHLFGARKVRAVIGRMRYSERSGVCNRFEMERAQSMADYFGIRLDTVDFEQVERGPQFIEQVAPLMRKHQLYSFNCLSHGKLAEFSQENTKGDETVFAGEISDGAHNLGFSQYATIFHPTFGFREYADKMASYLFGPTFLTLLQRGEHEQDPVYNLFRSRSGDVKFDAPAENPDARTMQLFTSFFLRNGRLPLWSADNIRLLTPAGRTLYTEEMQSAYLKDAAEKATKETLYSWYLHLYNSFHWQGSTVRTLPTLADAYGLRSDMPYWDGRMQEFLAAMPEDWGRGLDLNPTKYPLKWMLKHRIDYPYELQKGPHSYTYDVEHSFNHAVEVFYHSKMMQEFQKSLAGKPYHQLLSSEVFDLDYIDGLVDAYLKGEELPLALFNDLVPVAFLCHIGWFGKA